VPSIPFLTGVRAPLTLLAVVSLALACGGAEERAPEVEQPAAESEPEAPALNVVLITLDTTRADALVPYGQSVPTSPNIAAMVKEGVLFEQALSSSPSSTPSHASLFTGKHPYAHGVRSDSGYVLSPDNRTLAEHLREHGYTTAAQVASAVLGRQTRLDQGFDQYKDILKAVSPLDALVAASREEEVATRPGDEITREAIMFLRLNQDRPFFLWLHYYDAHPPHDPPIPFRRAVGGEDLYFAEVRRLDYQIGRFLYELVELGLRDRTLVVVTADHGEGRGDHGELTHSYYVYDSTMRIPLIFFGPDLVPHGARVASLVRAVDVAPTIVDLLGLPPLEDVQGRSLRPLIEDPARDLELTGYGESIEALNAFGSDPLRFIRVGNWKYIHKVDPELYDLDQDPGELENLAARHPERVAALRERLADLLRSAAPAPADAVEALDEEQRRELEALGHVAADAPKRLDDEVATLELGGPDPNQKLADYQAIAEARALLAEGKDPKAAAARFRALWRQNRDSRPVLYGLIAALLALQEREEVTPLLRRAIELDPASVDSRVTLANQLARKGEIAEAILLLRQALILDPCHGARQKLAGLLARSGKPREQIETLESRDPSCVESLDLKNTLAYALATAREEALRDGQRALELAQELVAADRDRPDFLDTQACALAELGDFEAAATVQRRAIDLAKRQQLPDWFVEVLQKHLAEFEAARPIRRKS